MRVRAAALLAVVVCLGGGAALAGPQDTRVGETRVLFAKAGTTLRATPATTGAAVATLAAGTRVTVLEVKLPWSRVSGTKTGETTPVEGWIRAYEAVEPQALEPAADPAHRIAAASGAVDNRDVATAGRQLTAGTEQKYRASRQDLAAAYAQVDRLEKDTAAMDPMDAIAFLMDGDLGRRGRDYKLPARKPAGDDLNERKKPRDVGGQIGKIGGDLLGRAGLGKKDVERVTGLLGGAMDYFGDLEKKFSPGQEYYLGRAVAASAIAKYGVEKDENVRRYVRQVGDAVVRLTSRAGGTYGGYHFEVLASREVNGVAGPGGYVLVTRGAVDACRTEDELAAILAHELGHVERKDGEAVLRKGKNFQASVKAAGTVVGTLTDVKDTRFGEQLLKVFTEAVGEMSRTATEHSYGRDLEFSADQESTYILHDVFYDWNGMRSYLMGLSASHAAHGGATHADPADRARALDAVLPALGAYPPRPADGDARMARFRAALGRPSPAGAK